MTHLTIIGHTVGVPLCEGWLWLGPGRLQTADGKSKNSDGKTGKSVSSSGSGRSEDASLLAGDGVWINAMRS